MGGLLTLLPRDKEKGGVINYYTNFYEEDLLRDLTK